jgi:DNA-binding transcriptional MerR regulator
MKHIDKLIEELGLQQQITMEDIPAIDLYMDQVIQLFDQKFSETKRNEEEKILTKTMINNYAKDKLFIPIKNKKYSKEHLILISLIFQLKGGLSINDIKTTLVGLNEGIQSGNLDLEKFYASFLNLAMKNVTSFNEEVKSHWQDVIEEMEGTTEEDNLYLKNVLLITSLINISNHYRRVAEKLVDEISTK